MNKLIRLSPTGIEYGDYAWNFASGCGNNLDGKCRGGGFNCWAYPITQRFADRYPNGFNPTIYPEALLSPLYLKKPSRILCAFMGDLFWDCPEFDPGRKIHSIMPSGTASISMSLKGWIFTTIKQCPQHTFLFLTKQPQNLPQWSPFPGNCYVGVTVTKPDFLVPALDALDSIQCSVRYLSIEPMLAAFDVPDLSLLLEGSVGWLILGSQSKPYKPPAISDVKVLVEAADKAGLKVFLKDSLYPVFNVQTEEDAFALKKNYPWAFRLEDYNGETEQIEYHGKAIYLRQEIPG